MGKTLSSLAIIGSVVALNVFAPGIGTLASGALSSAGVGVSAATAIGTALSLAATGLALQSAMGLIAGSPNLQKPDTASVPLKPPRPGSTFTEFCSGDEI